MEDLLEASQGLDVVTKKIIVAASHDLTAVQVMAVSSSFKFILFI